MTRSDTRRLQGVAVVLMFVHHLFGLPTLIAPDLGYIPTLPPLPLDELLGRYGKVCVALFLLVSGYGMARSPARRYRDILVRVLRFFATYWVYFALLIGIGAVFFADLATPRGPRFSLEPFRLATNALALRHDYAYEWWFAEVYVGLVLCVPLLTRALRYPLRMIAVSILAFLVGAVLDIVQFRTPILSISNLLIWQMPFVMGMVLAPGQGIAHRLPSAGIAAGIVICGTLAVELAMPYVMTPWLIATVPLSLLVWLNLVRRAGRWPAYILSYLGARALPLWLVHPFLVYYFAQPLVYAPVWAPLIVIWLLILTLAVVLPVEAARNAVSRLAWRALRPDQSRQ